MNPRLTIVDYGMGNLWSVRSAIEFLGYSVSIENDPNRIMKAERLLLPGVGSFRIAMKTLTHNGIAEAIIQAVKTRGTLILGICLGMQLLGSGSPEDGETDGLSLIEGRTDVFQRTNQRIFKIPHVGFDTVEICKESLLFRGLADKTDFYFVHEYRIKSLVTAGCVSICRHPEEFVAAIEVENIFATQFHPEKSQSSGLHLLRNFMEIKGC